MLSDRTACFAMTIALAMAPLAPTAPDPRPCDLFTAAEIKSVTGAAPARGQPEGPDDKEFPGATTWTCVWVGEPVFATRVLRFGSAAEATRAMKSSEEILKGFPEGMKLATVPGPGEQALWGASPEEGAIWVVRTGATILSVMVLGEVKNAERLREPLEKLTGAALAKVK